MFLTEKELAARWKMHPHSLGNWRQKGKGPRFVKISNKVLYRLSEIEKFEKHRERSKT